MGSIVSVPLPRNVAPDQTVDVSVSLPAPAFAGDYRGAWMLQNPAGNLFGTGEKATGPVWVAIKVKRIGEVHDGKYYQLNVDLSPFGGQEVKFVLQVQAFGAATGDRALWVAPRVVRISQPTSVPAQTPTPTRR